MAGYHNIFFIGAKLAVVAQKKATLMGWPLVTATSFESGKAVGKQIAGPYEHLLEILVAPLLSFADMGELHRVKIIVVPIVGSQPGCLVPGDGAVAG